MWDGFIARSAASWELLATTWIRGLERGGVIYYEELRLNPAVELPRIAKMLGIRTIDSERLQCVLRHNKDNTFKRQGDKPNYSRLDEAVPFFPLYRFHGLSYPLCPTVNLFHRVNDC